jgi:crotonobetainyl-CoA:carnitine CoA-transferase CaiB-like acyl-CoA transferase
MNNKHRKEGALSAYRALDLTDEKGFLCGKILADLGADVIKVEKPGGDPSRNLGPFYHDEPDSEKSLLWWAYNTSKRGITLDLTTRAGRQKFLGLVKKSDFVIESFTPGYLSGLGLSYEELSSINPGIILVSISGFGQDGPYARYKAPDIVCMAMSGYMNLLGDPDRPPLRISIPQAYLHASNDAATGALIALWYREMTGLGQWVDVSAQECMAWECFSNHIYWDWRKINPTRVEAGNASLTPGQTPLPVIFPCKDGYVLFTPTLGQQGHWTRTFVEWMEEEDMANDLLREFDWEMSATAVADLPEEERQQFREQLREKSLAIRESFLPFIMAKTRRELFEQSVAKGFMLAPVNSVHEVLDDIHFQSRGFWQTVEHAEVSDRITYPGAPFVAAGIPYQIRKRAPLIGEHNHEILYEELEISEDRITAPEAGTINSTEVFKGLRVIDMTWVTVGPRAVRYFADHGATVVKIEAPERPDIGRAVPPFKDEIPGPDRSGWFALYNVNKLGMSVNLNKPEALALVRQLIQWADVFIESYRPGTMKRLGLDYDSVKGLNPRLIYASTSQFGQTGPYRYFGGYGHHAAAMTGFDDLTGWPDRPPNGVFWAYTDHIAPQYLVSAIILALLQRQKTGKGQYIDQSQNEAALQFLAPAILDYTINGRKITRDGNRDPRTAPHNAYRCAGDDRWCVIAVYTDEEWQSLCRVIGQKKLIQDRRFATLKSRKENEAELDKLIEEWTCKLPAEIVMSRLQQAGVAAGVVARAEDVHCDPQFRLRRHFLTYDHPIIGLHDVDALPSRLSKTPARQYLREPCLGEHNAHVCTEILGMPDEEFVSLVQSGVFG